jgi:hypothetical protein
VQDVMLLFSEVVYDGVDSTHKACCEYMLLVVSLKVQVSTSLELCPMDSFEYLMIIL